MLAFVVSGQCASTKHSEKRCVIVYGDFRISFPILPRHSDKATYMAGDLDDGERLR